jgi:hypothetical protein
VVATDRQRSSSRGRGWSRLGDCLAKKLWVYRWACVIANVGLPTRTVYKYSMPVVRAVPVVLDTPPPTSATPRIENFTFPDACICSATCRWLDARICTVSLSCVALKTRYCADLVRQRNASLNERTAFGDRADDWNGDQPENAVRLDPEA